MPKLTLLKKALALALSLMMLVCLVPLGALAVSFSDVSGHWAGEVITKWAELGIIQGDGVNFRPDDPIRRGEFAVVIDRIMKYQTKSEENFTDLQNGYYYVEPMLKLNAAGVMNGIGDGKMNPDGFIERQQAMAMLARMFGITPDPSGLDIFSDAAETASWAAAEVGGLAKAGYVKGSGGKLDPKGELTRAQAIQLFDNLIKELIIAEGTYTVETEDLIVVNNTDVIVENSNIGTLIVSPGVGKGDFTLKGSTVGRLIVMGGGANSVRLEDSSVDSLSIAIDSSTGTLRIDSSGDSSIGSASVAPTTETITFTGGVDTLEVADGSTVIIQGDIGSVNIVGENVTIIIAEGVTVEEISVTGSGASLEVAGSVGDIKLDGEGSTVKTEETAEIKNITVNAGSTTIEGAGKVENVAVEGGEDVTVTTVGTTVTVGEDAGAVSLGGDKTAEPGETVVTESTTVTPPPSGGAPSSQEQYTVSFNLGGASGTIANKTVNAGSAVTLPTLVDVNGLTHNVSDVIIGWNTSSGGSRNPTYLLGASYTPGGNVTLHAVWASKLEQIVVNKIDEVNAELVYNGSTEFAELEVTLVDENSANVDVNITDGGAYQVDVINAVKKVIELIAGDTSTKCYLVYSTSNTAGNTTRNANPWITNDGSVQSYTLVGADVIAAVNAIGGSFTYDSDESISLFASAANTKSISVKCSNAVETQNGDASLSGTKFFTFNFTFNNEI